ncbi:MAG TPA: hypothetical protein ENH11_07005 [Candidatus Acetothermia bacterium]|nr:hypothetical protein [Candidatus Acetothermia bacterium]
MIIVWDEEPTIEEHTELSLSHLAGLVVPPMSEDEPESELGPAALDTDPGGPDGSAMLDMSSRRRRLVSAARSLARMCEDLGDWSSSVRGIREVLAEYENEVAERMQPFAARRINLNAVIKVMNVVVADRRRKAESDATADNPILEATVAEAADALQAVEGCSHDDLLADGGEVTLLADAKLDNEDDFLFEHRLEDYLRVVLIFMRMLKTRDNGNELQTQFLDSSLRKKIFERGTPEFVEWILEVVRPMDAVAGRAITFAGTARSTAVRHMLDNVKRARTALRREMEKNLVDDKAMDRKSSSAEIHTEIRKKSE